MAQHQGPYPQGPYPHRPYPQGPYPQTGPGQVKPAYGTVPQAYPPQSGYPPAQQGYQQPPQQGYPAGPQAGYPPGAPYQGQGGATPYPGPPQQGYPNTAAGPPPPGPGYQGVPPQGPPSYQLPPGQAPPPPVPESSAPSWQGETASEDVQDDPNATEPLPSAPPMAKMDQISGYGSVTFSDALLPPPTYDEATHPPPPSEHRPVANVPVISEDEARNSLLEYVAQHCCYGKGAAQNMIFRDLQSNSAFHYTLDTFCESRSTAWAYEPYKGQPVDGPMNGIAPGPWDIVASPPQKFADQVANIEIPHTASVKPCHSCYGNGRVRCFRCHGRGRVICHTCHGHGHKTVFRDGHHHHDHCTWCHGTGRRRCYTCHGHGQVACNTCAAGGQLKCFIKLTINWVNHFVDHIVERTNLPDELIRGVTGQTAFEEELPRLWPINHFPEQSINAASSQLIQRQSTAFPSAKILMQRHRVRIIPVTEVTYDYKDKTASFFVYGFEHKVHAPDYPQTCCWGCNIL